MVAPSNGVIPVRRVSVRLSVSISLYVSHDNR